MVQKHYVIIVGADPGVHFADWVEVAPLVKNYPSSIYQRAESEEEALRLFENARLKGQVRDLSLPPGSTASPGPPTASVRGSSNSSDSNTPHRKHPSAPKLTMSLSEAHVRNGVSSTRSNFGNSNTGSTAGRAATSLNCVIAISKSHSEPNPPTSASSSLKKVYERGCPASNGTGTFSCVGATSTRIRTRAESPSWLASYPGDETETEPSSSPALSPMASPAISSRSLESHRPVPFSTPSNSRYDGEAVEHIDTGSSEPVKSPVPSLRRQEVRGGSSSGVNQASGSKNTTLRKSSKNSRQAEATPQQQADIEPFVQLVVDEVLRRLRLPARVENESLPDSNPGRSSKSKRHNRNTENQSKKSNVLSPGSPSQRSRPPLAPGAGNLFSPGVPNGSLLFSRSQDDLGPLVRNSPLKQNGLCQHCKGTGNDTRVNASILDDTGLNQPSFAPIHMYGAAQDPRSPFTDSKKLASPFVFRRPSVGVSSNFSAKTTSF